MESTFRANERKVKSSQSRCSGKGTDEMFTPTWEFFKMLLFLRKTCMQGESTDSFSFLRNTPTPAGENIPRPSCDDYVLSPHGITIDEHSTNDVSPGLMSFYYDETLQKYIMIPPDTSTTSVTAEPAFRAALPAASPVSTSSGSSSQGILSPQSSAFRTHHSSISGTSGSGTPPPRPSSVPVTSLPQKRQHEENLLYAKRGHKKPQETTKPSALIEEAVAAVKDLAQQEIAPPKLDHFEMLGSYIASKLRSMSREDAEHYEKLLLEVLFKPREQ